MEKDKKIFETVSDMSVQDVLDEIHAGSFEFNEEDINLEDVLAEFSGTGEKTKKSPQIVKEKKVEVIEETIVEEIAVNAEDTIEN